MASSPEMSMRDRWSVVLVSDRLDYYDADKDLKIVRTWYDMVKASLTVTTSMAQLEAEANDEKGKKDSSMKACLDRAMKSKKSVHGLMPAENLVVTMFTDGTGDFVFYKEYNRASAEKIWDPYKVYTSLLLSAIMKLARINPLPTSTTLYRGINIKPDPPTEKRIFWKAFTSTTLELDVAKIYAGPDGILVDFQTPASHYAAKISQLSYFQDEEEVVLVPFEVFDYLGISEKMFQFRSSKTQEIFPP